MKKAKLLLASFVLLSSLVSCGGKGDSFENSSLPLDNSGDVSSSAENVNSSEEGNSSEASSEKVEEVKLTKKSFGLVNLTSYYDIKGESLDGYYLTAGSSSHESLLYVDVENFFESLDGYYDMTGAEDSVTSFTSSDNGIVAKWDIKDEDGEYSYGFTIDTEKDEITYDAYFLYNTVEQQGIDYSNHYSQDRSKYWSTLEEDKDPEPIKVSLKDYGADFVSYKDGEDNKTLVPFWVMNFIFCSQNYVNIYFNGDEFVATYMSWANVSKEDANKYFTSSTLGKSGGQTAEEREDVLNQLYFVYDYYYGLKRIPKGDNDVLYSSAKEYFEAKNPEAIANILSTDPGKNSTGYAQLIYLVLDEGHSYSTAESMFVGNNAFKLTSLSQLGERQLSLLYSYWDMDDALAKSAWVNDQIVEVPADAVFDENATYYVQTGEGPAPVEITAFEEGVTYYMENPDTFHAKFLKYSEDGKTAVLKFDEFSTADDVDIYVTDENGEFVLDENDEKIVSDEAYLYDTYWLFKKAFDEISSKPEVENVVIDVSNNGGGNIAAGIKALGFIVDDVKYGGWDQLLNVDEESVYNVETGRKDVGRENKSYSDKYNFSVLTSGNTYSCANEFAAVAKQAGYKIIGQKSGGGACSIMPFALSDGYSISTSSMNTIALYDADKNRTVYEYGIEVDAEASYADIVDIEKVAEIVASLNNQAA
jgi:hypothetical protein